MARLGEFEVHPAADAYPLIDGEEFAKLVDSVKRNGLREPIIVNHDRTVLIDGRNRYRACEQAGVDPVFEALGAHYDELKILNLIVDRNERRRDLNAGQRAMVALALEPMFAAAAKAEEAARKIERPSNQYIAQSSATVADLPPQNIWVEPQEPAERKSRERAAKAVGASGRAVQQAKAVVRDAPDLAAKVRSGELALDRADRERKARLAAMPKPDPVPSKPGPVMLTLRTHTGDEVPYPQPAAKATFNESKGDGISWAAWSWNPVTGCLHGCNYCLAPDTPVLMADMTWRPIGELRVGDELVGFDEESPQNVERRWRTSTVEATWRTRKTAHRIVFDDGREVVASADHQWLCSRNRWRTTAQLAPGSRVRAPFPVEPIAQDEDYQAGYIAGVTLGDGTFRWDPSWRSDKLGFPQSYWRVAVLETDRVILDRLREFLGNAGVDVEVRPFSHSGPKPMAKVETRRLADMPVIDKLCRERASDTWWAGWLAGMFDAEGSTSGGSLRISQKDAAVLDAVAAAGARFGFTFKVETWDSGACSTARLVGDVVEKARFAAMIRPALARKGPGLDGRKVRTSEAVVVSVTASVEVEMVDITTSTRTFVAEGLLTHNCYAREIATAERFKAAYPAGFTPLFHHERLDAPANTVIPAAHRDDPDYQRVFVCSMADLYGRWVPGEWIDQVHASMCANPRWQYITLTKFPARYVGLDMPPGAWVGTSVDEQKRVRIAEDAFRQIDGVKVRWLSLEPLREPLEFTDLSMFDWVVIGAQTETRQPGGVTPAFAPPFEWVARIVAQAREAGCRVHLKPNLLGAVSGQRPGMALPDEYPELS